MSNHDAICEVETDFVGTAELSALNDGLAEHGVNRELGHAPPHFSEFSAIVHSAERIQEFQSPHQSLPWRRVHELEADQVVDAQRFEQQYHHS